MPRSNRLISILFSLLSLFAGSAWSGEADVIRVEVEQTGAGVYRFHVTVRHADEGWEHYADRWDVVAPDGSVLGTRTLLHPHVNEQPFTRSLGDVGVPEELDRVTLRAHDSVHGYGGEQVGVRLPHR